MRFISGNKKPHLTKHVDVNRGFKDIYDTLNKLIDAVNSSFLPHETFKGKRGDIRVNDEGFQYHDGRNWQRIASGTEGHQEPALRMSTDLPRVPANTLYQGDANGRVQASPLQYPSADGTSNQPVVTSGAGILSFSSTVDLNEITSSGNFEIDAGGDITLDAGGQDINFNVSGTGPRLNWNAGQGLRIYSPNDLSDMFNILVGIDHAGTTIQTVDASGSQGHIAISADGDLRFNSATGVYKASKGGTEFSAADSAYAGMILGYTHLTTSGGASSFSIGTSQAVIDSNGKVSFTAPPSGNVEIEFSIFRDSSSDNKTVIFSLSDNATFNQATAETGDGSTTYDLITAYGFDTPDETDDKYLTGKFVVGGLTSGTSYTYWLGAGGGATTHLRWGGNTATNPDRYYPPFVIKATALPASIYTG